MDWFTFLTLFINNITAVTLDILTTIMDEETFTQFGSLLFVLVSLA